MSKEFQYKKEYLFISIFAQQIFGHVKLDCAKSQKLLHDKTSKFDYNE